MATRIFNVPVDSIVEFTEILQDNELDGVIIGIANDDEIVIEVCYGTTHSEAVLSLIDFLDNLEYEPENDEVDDD